MSKRIEAEFDEYGFVYGTEPTYDDIVATFGEILVESSDDDYQGDSLYLIRREGECKNIGLLTFGWGSCSGCDALQAVSTPEDLDSLQADLERGIRWFYDVDDVGEYLRDGGLKGTFLRGELILDFFAKVKALAN